MTISYNVGPLQQRKLWEAAAKGDSAMIRILALSGVDLDAPNPEGLTAFALANQNNHADTAMTILAAREMQYLQKVGHDLRTAGQDRKSA